VVAAEAEVEVAGAAVLEAAVVVVAAAPEVGAAVVAVVPEGEVEEVAEVEGKSQQSVDSKDKGSTVRTVEEETADKADMQDKVGTVEMVGTGDMVDRRTYWDLLKLFTRSAVERLIDLFWWSRRRLCAALSGPVR
jgi:hypothetical protein